MKIYYLNNKGDIIDVVELPIFFKRRQFQDSRNNKDINGGFYNGEETYWDRVRRLFNCLY